MRDAFTLDPERVHLNHGSFGAVPRAVQDEQQRLRTRMDADPDRFFRVELPGLVAAARAAGAAFLGVDEIALVRNPTESVATVLSTLAWQRRLGPGDSVVVSQQGYGAVSMTVSHWCERTGARLEVAALPVGVSDTDVVAAYCDAFHTVEHRGDAVRLVVVDQVTSPTGTVLPVAEVATLAREHGALVLVDAAHGPGQLPADVSGADFWTGAFHKWAYAPRGTSALWVSPAERTATVPLTTSWNHGQPFPGPFDLRGTDDYTGWAALPAALDFWRSAGGFEIGARASALLEEAVLLFGAAGRSPRRAAPCLRLVALPAGLADTLESADALFDRLGARGVEAQPVAYDGHGYLRLSANLYNEIGDYQRLADALGGMGARA